MKYSTSQLEELALDTFKANPSASKVLATSDGNIFLADKENLARLHAAQNKLELQTINRPEPKAEAAADQKPVAPVTPAASVKPVAPKAAKPAAKVTKSAPAKEETPSAPAADTDVPATT